MSLAIALAAVLHLRGMAAEVVLLLEACPAAAISSVFAVQFHYDEERIAGCVILSTILSIATLPLTALLITAIM